MWRHQTNGDGTRTEQVFTSRVIDAVVASLCLLACKLIYAAPSQLEFATVNPLDFLQKVDLYKIKQENY